MFRLLEFIFAFILLIITLPISMIFSIIIFFETRQSPIYVELRAISLKHKRFKIYKLRTIKNSHTKNHKPHTQNNIFIKRQLLKHVTWSGKFLRKTGLDELPQLINILKGEMSFIGPRPFNIPDLKKMKDDSFEIYLNKENILYKPGITGCWQVFGNREKGTANLVSSEIFYEKNKNIILDLKIILATFQIIFLGRHSDSIISDSHKKIKPLKTIFQS